MHADATALLGAYCNRRTVCADAHEAYVSRMVARAMLNDDVIVARLTELLKSLRKLPSYAQQLARQVLARTQRLTMAIMPHADASSACKDLNPTTWIGAVPLASALLQTCSCKKVTATTDHSGAQGVVWLPVAHCPPQCISHKNYP